MLWARIEKRRRIRRQESDGDGCAGERHFFFNEFSPVHYLVRWVRVKFCLGVRVSGMNRVRVDVGVRVRVTVVPALGDPRRERPCTCCVRPRYQCPDSFQRAHLSL